MVVRNIDQITLNEFHRIIMDSTAMWLNMLDKDGKVLMWNKAAEMISGYSKEEVLGRSDIWELLYPEEEYRNKIFAKAMSIINQGKEVTDFETTIQCKDGSDRVLSWNSHDMKDEYGEICGSMALARDVTEIHDKNKKLKELTEDLGRTNLRLLQLSEIDELTGLYNRRSMDKILQDEWNRHIRSAVPLSLLYIDIDYFKQYNDTYGHHKGDEVLVEIATIFKNHVKRATDKAARFGGEEFAIILPETIQDKAMKIAEKVRLEIEQKGILHQESKIANVVTVSIGVATISHDSYDSITQLKLNADKALYKAKESGRNRIDSY